MKRALRRRDVLTRRVARMLSVAYFLRCGSNTMWTITSGRLSHWLDPDVLNLGFGFRDTVTRIALTRSPFVAGQLYARGRR